MSQWFRGCDWREFVCKVAVTKVSAACYVCKSVQEHLIFGYNKVGGGICEGNGRRFRLRLPRLRTGYLGLGLSQFISCKLLMFLFLNKIFSWFIMNSVDIRAEQSIAKNYKMY